MNLLKFGSPLLGWICLCSFGLSCFASSTLDSWSCAIWGILGEGRWGPRSCSEHGRRVIGMLNIRGVDMGRRRWCLVPATAGEKAPWSQPIAVFSSFLDRLIRPMGWCNCGRLLGKGRGGCSWSFQAQDGIDGLIRLGALTVRKDCCNMSRMAEGRRPATATWLPRGNLHRRPASAWHQDCLLGWMDSNGRVRGITRRREGREAHCEGVIWSRHALGLVYQEKLWWRLESGLCQP